MTDEERALKNDVLDILEDYLNIIRRFNNGDVLSTRAGSFRNKIKMTKESIHRLRNAAITEEK